MTRQFNQEFHCPNCKTRHTAETLFGRWIRDNPKLDSARDAIVVSDADYLVQKYKTQKGRNFQLVMIVEVKTNGSTLSNAQRDLLTIFNQLLRNRKQTPSKALRHQAGSSSLEVFSTMSNRHVKLKAFGIHLLTFSRLGPDDSKEILWDNKPITKEQLTELMRFDLDPDTLNPIDLRSHHQAEMNLEDTQEQNLDIFISSNQVA